MPKDTPIIDPKKQILAEERKKNERWFETRWEQIGGQKYKHDKRFHPTRRWRFDYQWSDIKVALEIDGGGHKIYWAMYRRDVEKMNAALFLGWQVFRVTTDMVRADDIGFLEELKMYMDEPLKDDVKKLAIQATAMNAEKGITAEDVIMRLLEGVAGVSDHLQIMVDSIVSMQKEFPMPREGWENFVRNLEYTNRKHGLSLVIKEELLEGPDESG